MSISIRLRSKAGQENIKGLDGNCTLKSFQETIAQKTGIAPSNQKILAGYPPKPLDTINNQDSPISSFITNGDSLTVEELASTTPPPVVSAPPSSNSNSSSNLAAGTSSSSSDGYVIRRLTENDNSCLFSAVAYVLENKNRGRASHLRSVIVQSVKSDPFTFNEGFLGKENSDYCKWITDPKHWGGAIELSILSQHYKIEIGAFDIATKILYCYGEDQNYTDRVYVIYDGIHYDALSICLVKDGPEDYDITQFSSKDKSTLEKMKSFIDRENKEGNFTDTANFQLICLECNKILKGEKEAALHAGQTKHGKFTELKNKQ
ncbi:C2H2-type zinc finger-containing protein [Cavenderia fasciculata]|uniref:Ubiquitin thioesterase OTU n=1 Tax=Cavenderia fasciculata TaxID=261658 RepID=F4PWR1_CACFS|nr:C2H2-type zinc finger-containing protein [Cavenderia fasciculata]EGG20425.1 C2H2-type zinc finger-containing protein [Cavenderia fasciculata]|eukprot:XP_004367408.1 C2H2-type zinc finger-containing protein [Cavenderia fasciculata]